MKTYLPDKYINSNFHYRINDDYIVVITDNNCYNQYSTQYCDCVNVYPKLDYIESNIASCAINSSFNYLSYDKFTSDIYYRIDLPDILLIFTIFFFFIILIPFKIMSRVFGRWLKV